MKISVRWLNEYLDPANLTAAGAEQVLTDVGFPIESATDLPSGDVLIDVEVTSNRGDCLSHIGLAREIAAATGRRLRLPKIPATVPSAEAPGRREDTGRDARATSGTETAHSACRLENRVPQGCKLFTARIIRNVKVGPSPAWLVEALEAVGQRAINNIVDISNYVLFEFGQPSHVFDLARIRRGQDGKPHVIVRFAAPGERLRLLDEREVKLEAGDLVVADADGAVSLAGIMGGLGSEVTERTSDVLIEAATWDPVTIRRTGRRLQLRTDASHRFERLVDPRTIDLAARRAAALILQLAGGSDASRPGAPRLLPGVLHDGAPAEPPTRLSLRVRRCREILGLDVPTPDMIRVLRAHEIQASTSPDSEPTDNSGSLDCVVPPHRPDLEREIDLFEEVARTHGLAKLPLHDKLAVRVAPAQASELAARELATSLTGLGFFETITFTFVSPAAAAPFLPAGLEALTLCDVRRKADPILRPSVLPSLLACRRSNQDGGVYAPGGGGVRFFETASIFAQPSTPGHETETRVLAILADAAPLTTASVKAFEARQDAVRLVRGALEAVAAALGGPAATLEVHPVPAPIPAFDSAASAEVRLAGRRIGTFGLISQKLLHAHDLHTPVAAAEVELEPLLALYPPKTTVHQLPHFPGIERDLSLIVRENIQWAAIDKLIADSQLDRLETWDFVTTYRGQQAGPGKKSVTVRLRFRDPARTLRHEEVDPQMTSLVRTASEKLGAEVRT